MNRYAFVSKAQSCTSKGQSCTSKPPSCTRKGQSCTSTLPLKVNLYF